MKKILAILLAFVLAFSMAACGTDTATQSSAPESVPEANAPAADPAEPSEAPAAPAEPDQEPDAAQASDAEADAEPLAQAEIQVFIAASLDNAFQDIVKLYQESQPNVTVTLNADSSGKLLTQIEEGFTCDIFFSAAVAQIKSVEDEGYSIEGTRVDLLKNTLDLITYKGSGTAVTGMENLGDASSMALADGSVPAGKYTRKALQALGVLDDSVEPADITTQAVSEALDSLEINETENVSKTLEAVAEGSNEIGTVYHSDAYSRIDEIEIIESVSTDLTGEILYPMVRIQNPEADDAVTAAADDFFAFLQTPEVMEIFEQYMFISNK